MRGLGLCLLASCNGILAFSAPALSKAGVFTDFSRFIEAKQKEIITALETEEGPEGGRFLVDTWEREGGGGYGATCVLEGGKIWEKAAVSTSIIKGTLSPERAAAMSARGRTVGGGGGAYQAAALSLVLHSSNPHLPTFRSDVRYFEVEGQPGWYGGGADLTPYVLYDEDISSFHRFYKGVCDKHGPGLYQEYKAWCDKYFYLPMRGEHRGTGGLFFDDLQELKQGGSEGAEAFVRDVCDGFMPSYLPLVRKRKDMVATEKQREWMLVRRSRYIEFNLLYDRGVKFGLVPGGRVESVMVSAPPLVAWKYKYAVEPGSEEARLLDILKIPKEWC